MWFSCYDQLDDKDLEYMMSIYPIKLIEDEDWPNGKLCPTEFSYSDKDIKVKKSYYLLGDPCLWLMHEYVHAFMLNVHGTRPKINDKYPDNSIETCAFVNQFRRLIANGVNTDTIMNNVKFKCLKRYFIEYSDIMNKYWNRAMELT